MAWQHGPSSEARLNWALKAPPPPICSSSELNVLRILHVCMRMVTLWCMVSTHLRRIYSVVLNISVFRCGKVMFASLSRKRTSPRHGRTRRDTRGSGAGATGRYTYSTHSWWRLAGPRARAERRLAFLLATPTASCALASAPGCPSGRAAATSACGSERQT